MYNIIKSKKGLTLIEMLIAITVAVFIAVLVISLFVFNHNFLSKEEQNYDIQNDVRVVTDYIVRTTRNATSLEIISISVGKSEISAGDLYNYILIDSDGRVHSYITDGSGGYSHFTYGNNINYANSYFQKDDTDTLRIRIEAMKDDQSYQSDVKVFMANFEFVSPSPEIAIAEGDHRAIKFKLP